MALKDWNLEAAEEEQTLLYMRCKHEFKHKNGNFIYCSFCGKLIVERTLEHFEEENIHRIEAAQQKIQKMIMCNLKEEDPDFNTGKGNKFFNALDRAIKRGDFN